jgi:hypothetical protein
MGSSSSSTVNQKYDTTIVNKSDINVLNENINNFVANTVVNQASDCSASISQLQTIDLSGMDVEGDLEIGEVSQSQKSNITFDCVQVSKFQNNIASGVLSEFSNAMKNSYTAETLDKLEAVAKSEGSGGFGTTGKVSSNSKVNVDYQYTNITDTRKNLQNVVKNAITNNMSMNDTQSCVAKVAAAQKFTLADSKVRGSVRIGAIKQDQASTLMAKCMQEKGNANKITNSVASALGVKIDETNSVKKITEISSSASSTAKNSGFFQSIGEGIGSIFSGLFGGLFGGLGGPISISSSVCCCIIIMIVAIFFASGGVDDIAAQASGEDDGGFGMGGGFLNKMTNSHKVRMNNLR